MNDDDRFGDLVALGNRASKTGDLDGAEAAFRAALALRPDNAPVQYNLALLLLSLGRYPEGWSLYESRFAMWPSEISRSGIPQWRGEPLNGKSLLIWPEQGLGDEIQMARFAPRLREMGAIVVLVCTPALARLFQSLGVTVAPLVDGLNLPRTHYQTPVFSTPNQLGLELQGLSGAPYLRAAADPHRGGVGFVWKGSPDHPNDANRSLPSPALLDPLRGHAELIDLQVPQGDFLDTARRVQALDLVITVDTSMAHLCGALGVPCWVMLSQPADWRWLRQGDRTPWYDSLRLYRQPAPGDWTSVVEAMRRDLAQMRTNEH